MSYWDYYWNNTQTHTAQDGSFIHQIQGHLSFPQSSCSCAATIVHFIWAEHENSQSKLGSCKENIVACMKTWRVQNLSETMWNPTLTLWTMCFHSTINDRKEKTQLSPTHLQCKTAHCSLPGQLAPITELVIVTENFLHWVLSTHSSCRASKHYWTEQKRGRAAPQRCYLGLHLVSSGTLVWGTNKAFVFSQDVNTRTHKLQIHACIHAHKNTAGHA